MIGGIFICLFMVFLGYILGRNSRDYRDCYKHGYTEGYNDGVKAQRGEESK